MVVGQVKNNVYLPLRHDCSAIRPLRRDGPPCVGQVKNVDNITTDYVGASLTNQIRANSCQPMTSPVVAVD